MTQLLPARPVENFGSDLQDVTVVFGKGTILVVGCFRCQREHLGWSICAKIDESDQFHHFSILGLTLARNWLMG
jgi:hypothetical protein